jgi:hypothetical protein
MAEMPEYATELGYKVGRIYNDEILEIARDLSKEIFDSPDLIKDFFRPYLYLNVAAIDEKGLDRRSVAEAIADGLEQASGIAGAISSHSPQAGSRSFQSEAVRHNHHNQRSGDIYVFQQPYWFFFDRGPIGAMHGSPWAYDTHVPIVFVGSGIKPANINRLVHPIDVAPTISAYLGLSPPAASQGEALLEVVENLDTYDR